MADIKYKLIADVALISEGSVLLVKYKDKNKYDHQPGWFLPDDLLQDFEHPEDAAVRILHEQLKLSNINPKLDHIESFKGRDSSWHLAFHFKAEIAEVPDIVKSDEVKIFDWFDLSELPEKEEVAHHGWALYTLKTINS